MEAVYQLLHIERGVPEVFGSLVDFSCDLTPNRRYDHRDGIEPPTLAFSRLASFQ
jgi:myosin-crossreactive antigen